MLMLYMSTLFAAIASQCGFASGAPPDFPASGNGLWYTFPGTSSNWVTEWLPIGNGYLAAMSPGGTRQELTQLNIESLWSGGPFQDKNYNGGNKQSSERGQMAQDMHQIRQTIFQDGTIDDIEELSTDPGAYGSYSASGYLVSFINGSTETAIAGYARWLDLDQALARTTWTQGKDTFSRTSLCSHATRACTQHIIGSGSVLPSITHAFSTDIVPNLPQANVSCVDDATLLVQGNVALPGMAYELLFRATALGNGASISCQQEGTTNATLSIEAATESWISWVGDTEYNMDAGNSAHGFSFSKPLAEAHAALIKLLDSATTGKRSFDDILSAHVASYKTNLGDMSLTFDANRKIDLSTLKTTDQLKAEYKTDVGDSYLEWLLFNYGRYLLASSAPGILPANLQGKWAADTTPPWSADYHSNINIQMNYWFAEITGMPSNVITPLFDYIEKTWLPRGEETALILYNISRGFVTHNEMNIFGHTGMKLFDNSAQWADYPESAVWMMIHVWDHFDYTRDTTWWRSQGWPLLKSVAEFHLDKLIPDSYHNDATLVVAPCNSPEQVPITFGCSHAQQLIWQLFNAVEKGWEASGDSDISFIEEVRTKRAQMDKGIHIGSWGQLQEWKLDMDSPNDTHRHLSHLIGLYPGYAVSGFDSSAQGSLTSNKNNSTYSRSEVLGAAKISLIHRGNGTGPDGDAGWEKVWRAAAWAQFADAEAFYHQLTYAVERNYGPNLFSLYDPLDTNPIFQIDANFGYPAAVLNGLVQVPDVPSTTTPIVITLLPALPQAWASGSLHNIHLRGGLVMDLDWANGRPTNVKIVSDKGAAKQQVNIVFNGTIKPLTAGTQQILF